jgi:Flp pilus assembly protein TadG
MRTFRTNIAGDEKGTTAIEFAIVGPVFILLLIGIFFLCMGLAVAGSLHYAVEEGARCASVRTMICSDNDTTITYTKNHYYGPSSMPTFNYDAAATCGHSVSATINYTVDLGLKQITVPMTAAACFP